MSLLFAFLILNDEEVHHQRLYKEIEILQALHQIGSQVKTKCSYGEFNLPRNHTAFIAIK